VARKVNESDVLKWSQEQEERFWAKIRKGGEDECWEWEGYRGQDGYGQYWVGYRNFRAHRIAWLLTYRESISPGLCVMHVCDNPPCCNPSHLKLGTIAENNLDRALKGRSAQGESHGNVHLKRGEVLQIREMHFSGLTIPKLANGFGVGRNTIHDIVTGRTWASVGGPTVKRRPREELKGEGNPSAKLTKNAVVQIREKYSAGATARELADEFSVTETTIYDIVKGRTWRHTGEPIKGQSEQDER